ncbi:MAG: hypothetical protein HC925_00300 [Coleofasciculaceae cyanobacterium SM2_3_26]|nr:hypothetical protein [Coleofasciculaceae cyanobacterium SM2_3_26]
MQATFFLSRISLADLFDKIWQTGYMTETDRYGLMSNLLKNTLTEEERVVINRILHAVRRGWIQLADE